MEAIRGTGNVACFGSQYALSELRHGIIILPSAKCSKCGLQTEYYLHYRLAGYEAYIFIRTMHVLLRRGNGQKRESRLLEMKKTLIILLLTKIKF